MKTHFADDDTRIAELERDAARYRWLRNEPPSALAVRSKRPTGEPEALYVYLDGDVLDEAIDAAIAAGRV